MTVLLKGKKERIRNKCVDWRHKIVTNHMYIVQTYSLFRSLLEKSPTFQQKSDVF